MPAKSLPLDIYFWIPWKGPVVRIFESTITELPDAPRHLTFLCSLAAVGHCVDAVVENIGGGFSKTTLYIGIIGHPASGKTSVAYHIFNSLKRQGIDIPMVGARTSSEGLARILAEKGNAVHIADEVHQVFKGKRRESYVGEVLDLWKTLYNRVPLTFARRSKRRTIDIPESARLTVIFTTTYDDFEEVTSIIDRALLRRFMITTSDQVVDPWKKSGNAEKEWVKIAGEIQFLQGFVWRIHFEDVEKAESFRRLVFQELGLDSEEMVILSEQSIRVATILALDRLVSYLEKRIEASKHSIPYTVERTLLWDVSPTSVRNRLEQELQGVLMGIESNIESTLPIVDLSKRVQTHTESQMHPSSTITNTITRSSHLPRENITRIDLSKCVEDDISLLSNICRRAIQLLASSKSRKPVLDSVDLAKETAELVNIMKNMFIPPPTPELLEGNVVRLWTPPHYLILGLGIVASSILASRFVREWIGCDERWAYFVRRLRDLASKGWFEVTLRDIARYMKKFRGYRELRDYVERAVVAGILEVVEHGSSDSTTKFKIRLEIEGEKHGGAE